MRNLKDLQAKHQERLKRDSEYYRPLAAFRELTDEAFAWLIGRGRHDLEAYLDGAVQIEKRGDIYTTTVTTMVNPLWQANWGDGMYADGEKGRIYRRVASKLPKFDADWTLYQVFLAREEAEAKRLELMDVEMPRFHVWRKDKTAVTPEDVRQIMGIHETPA
jgi:hypothetical protein